MIGHCPGAALVLVAAILVACVAPVAWSQDSDIDEQLWLDVNPAYFFNPDLKLYGDIGVRTQLDAEDWWRLVIRPSVRKRIKGTFHVAGGLGSFYTFNTTTADSWGIRPFQGVDFDWPHGKTFSLHHYIRLEEKFDFNTETWVAKTSLRVRSRLSLKYKWAAVQEHRFWQLSGSAEGFWTLTGEQGQFQESSRWTLGLDRSLNRGYHGRVEITLQKGDYFLDPDVEISDVYLRIRFFKSWGHRGA